MVLLPPLLSPTKATFPREGTWRLKSLITAPFWTPLYEKFTLSNRISPFLTTRSGGVRVTYLRLSVQDSQCPFRADNFRLHGSVLRSKRLQRA
jgi:hypothetical protein